MKPKLFSVERKVQEINHVETGAGFRAERERAGISLRELAAAANMTAPYVSDLEQGKRNWTQERLNFWTELLINLKATKAKAK